jgi:hypothetical protein
MISSEQKAVIAYTFALVLIIVGFVVGYNWLVIIGFLLEFIIWVCAMLFDKNKQDKETH